jgi:hypothetical protein
VTGEALVGQGFFRPFVSVDAYTGPSGEAPSVVTCPGLPTLTCASAFQFQLVDGRLVFGRTESELHPGLDDRNDLVTVVRS